MLSVIASDIPSSQCHCMESHKNPSYSDLWEECSNESKELMLSLPKERWLFTDIYLYQGFWALSLNFPSIVTFQRHFEARDDDIILASFPKSGTTWLKALLFSVATRSCYSMSNTPLLTSNPHELVKCFEFDVYKDKLPDLEALSSPRLFSTHIPYAPLPESIRTSNCRIVYVCRNPFDTLVSTWKFEPQIKIKRSAEWTMEEYFNSFCRGAVWSGPYWDHVLGYWNKSLEMPNKVLFLKYEDLKKDTRSQLKKLAEFIGFPFSPEEEKQGVIENIVHLCSLSKLKDLDVNKTGFMNLVENKCFFRKGEVGDWVNHLSPSMVERLDNLMKEKLSGSGLTFESYPHS